MTYYIYLLLRMYVVSYMLAPCYATVLPSPAVTPPCWAATPNTQHPHRLPTAEDAADHHQIGKELLGVRQRLGVTCLLCDISLLVDRQPGTLD